jgi:hypothetical protein
MANENIFTDAKQSLILRPKSIQVAAFKYNESADLMNLISFVGKEPKVKVDKGKMVLTFGKKDVKEGNIVLRNSYGEVTNVFTPAEANDKYEIVASSEFKPEHANKIAKKPPRKSKKAETK